MALKSLWNKPKESFEEGAAIWSPFYGHGVVVDRGPDGLPVTRLGTTGGETLVVQGVLAVGVDELRAAHEGTLPALFG